VLPLCYAISALAAEEEVVPMVRSRKEKRSWMAMLAEQGVRERISRFRPEALVLLDYLETRIHPYEDQGWTVFNDWLDDCYAKLRRKDWPQDIPFVQLNTMRTIVFPACA